MAATRAALADRFGLVPVDLHLDDPHVDPSAVLGGVDLIVVGGGDPFALLAAARASGFDHAVGEAVARGATYVGISAGALLAGPTLAPAAVTSPFAPADGLDLSALGLVDVVVLPHDDRPGRAARHDEAAARFPDLALVRLRDDEGLLVDDGGHRVVPSP